MHTNDFLDDVADYHLSEHDSLSEDIDLWIDRYRNEITHLSPLTQKSYIEALQPFASYCQQHDGIVGIEQIGAKFINNYLRHYVRELADRDYGLHTYTNRDGEHIATKKVLTDEEYTRIINNDGRDLGRNNANLFIPFRYEKTVSHRLTILKQLLKFISENNIEQHDYTTLFPKIAAVKVQKRRTDYLTSDELERLVDVCESWPEIYKRHVKTVSDRQRLHRSHAALYTAYRNSLLVMLYALTGMRASEAFGIRLRDFKPFEMHDDDKIRHYYAIRIVSGKGDKEREVVAPVAPLQHHLEFMHKTLSDPNSLIASRRPGVNEPIRYPTLHEYSRYIYAAAGIDKSGFHMIRRGYATDQLANGKSITQVALQLGHRSQNTTFESYVKNNPELLAKDR